MEFKRLTDGHHELFPKAMDLYKESFPLHEQRLPQSQQAIMSHPQYHFNLIYEGDIWIGLMLNWETDEYIYVEHFCILPEMRNKRYGQRALELLLSQGKPVILEIDPPVDEVSIHRQGFYQRSGFVSNAFSHVHPPYRAGFAGHPLVVMSCPEALTEAQYQAFARHLAETVMGI